MRLWTSVRTPTHLVMQVGSFFAACAVPSRLLEPLAELWPSLEVGLGTWSSELDDGSREANEAD